METNGIDGVFDTSKVALVLDISCRKESRRPKRAPSCALSQKTQHQALLRRGALGIEHALLPEKGSSAAETW
jgi:hypothetical protein